MLKRSAQNTEIHLHVSGLHIYDKFIIHLRDVHILEISNETHGLCKLSVLHPSVTAKTTYCYWLTMKGEKDVLIATRVLELFSAV